MNRRLSQLFDTLNAQELDTLLDGVQNPSIDKNTKKRIRKKALEKAAIPQRGAERRRWRHLKTFLPLSAALLLVITVGIGAFAAEQKEYREALFFFEAHDLPYDSLTRSEIKEIYRDITEERFVYDKTADVIGQGMIKNSVDGYEIIPDTPSPEEIKVLWQRLSEALKNPATPEGIRYAYRNEYVNTKPDGTGIQVFDRAYFEIFDGETLISSTVITDFYIDSFVTVSDGVLVYGATDRNSSLQTTYAHIAKINNNGKLEWQRALSGDYHTEFVVAALEEKSGNYAVFFRGDFVNLGFVRLGKSGKVLTQKITEIGNYGVSRAKEVENGFLLQLWSAWTGEYAKILKVLPDGTVSESYSYTHPTEKYFITDFIEFNGKIYLSAYATPKDTSPMHDYAHSAPEWDTSDRGCFRSEGLNAVARESHTAYLLVCNKGTGTPEEFYSVKASRDGFLSVDENGNLVWQVGQILSVYYSPATSSFTFAGTSRIIEYTFSPSGTLLQEEKNKGFISFRE
ncbi:MAG: hypothetical protein IJW46_03000 [Clostridia bacterium]|nr:hypothetical protein [Clostridia bacterium]